MEAGAVGIQLDGPAILFIRRTILPLDVINDGQIVVALGVGVVDLYGALKFFAGIVVFHQLDQGDANLVVQHWSVVLLHGGLVKIDCIQVVLTGAKAIAPQF